MSTGPVSRTACGFRTTSWTLIDHARNGDGLAELLERYWSPIYAYLKRDGHSEEDALDLTQGFLTAKLLERSSLINRADANLGRFRSYLLRSLQNYVRDEYRRNHRKNGPTFIPDDPAIIAASEPCDGDDPGDAFNRQWAATTFESALQQVERDCHSAGMQRQWRAFEAWVLLPTTRNNEPIPIEALVNELGARDEQQVYDMVRTVKNKYKRVIRELIHETVASADDVEQELARLRRYAGA